MDRHHSILFQNSLMVVPKMHAEIGMDRVAPISEVTLLRFRIASTFLFFESLAILEVLSRRLAAYRAPFCGKEHGKLRTGGLHPGKRNLCIAVLGWPGSTVMRAA